MWGGKYSVYSHKGTTTTEESPVQIHMTTAWSGEAGLLLRMVVIVPMKEGPVTWHWILYKA